MQVKGRTGGITFSVHDVEPNVEKLNVGRTDEMVKLLLDSVETRPGNVIEACSGYNDKVVGVDCHGLIGTVYQAFAAHYPLVLSPDMLWITILQGFAQHVAFNSEGLRGMFVRHLGRKTLAVTAPILEGTPENDWAPVIHGFAQLVHENVGTAYGELVSDFSTTGELEKLVCEVSLMDVFKPYFFFELLCICGIPEVTLEGTPDDWRNLRAKVDSLSKYDLEWWLADLRPITEQFCRAAEGDVDVSFWQNILKLQAAYGWAQMNGWITRLVPYIRDHTSGAYNRRNPVLGVTEAEIEAQFAKADKTFFGANHPCITTRDVPSGLAQVPFKMKCENGRDKNMQFLAGFVGFEQIGETAALRPKLGWAVRQAR